MSLLDQIGRMFRRGSAAPPTVVSRPEQPAASSPLLWATELRAAQDRKTVIAACRDMYETDTRATQVIETLARDMVRGGFDVQITAGPVGQVAQALEIAAALQERLSLDQRLDDWIRLTLRDGDSFLELGIDASLDIVDVTRKSTLKIRRASDQFDRFADPQRAFWQGDEWLPDAAPPSTAVWFAEWQLIHARWRHDEDRRYGRPLFASAHTSFKRLTSGETDMAVRRRTRAGLKYIHEFPAGTDPDVIEQYKELNKDALDNPTAAIADFFGTVKVSAVQGDAQLGQIDDVIHHLRTWFLASPVAMSLLGYGQDLNRDVLDKQEEQYQRALEGLTAWPTAEIVKPLLERQWLLQGIWPAGLKYQVTWRAKQLLTAAAVGQAADAGLKLRALGAPTDVVRRVIEQLLPGVELGALWQAQDPAPPAPAGTRETRARPARIAQAAAELQAALG